MEWVFSNVTCVDLFQIGLLFSDVHDYSSDVNITSIGTCHKRLSWVNVDPNPLTVPVETLRFRYRVCLYNNTSCDDLWELLTEHPPDLQSFDIDLSPNEIYSFSVISCNTYFGCSEDYVIPIDVSTIVQGVTTTTIIYFFNVM